MVIGTDKEVVKLVKEGGKTVSSVCENLDPIQSVVGQSGNSA